MTLSKNFVEEQRRRLKNHEHVSKTTGLNRVGGGAFGLVFVIVGVFAILLGLDVVPADPSDSDAPGSVVIVCGGLFVAAGAFIWRMVLQEQRLIQSRRVLAQQHPHSLAFADYPWDPTGITKSPWLTLRNGVLIVTFVVLFLVPFNWWAWFSEDPRIFVKIIVSLFDLGGLLMVVQLGRMALVALKYGKSRLEYAAFPIVTGSHADLRWFPPAGLKQATRITFVLRCVEEWMEATGAGDDRTTELIHEQLWASTCTMEGPVACRHDYPLALLFELSTSAPGSNLSDELKIIFWELEVKAEAPGVDFQERYLVPVYPNATLGSP